MYLFKERLGELISHVIFIAIFLGVIAGAIGLLSLINQVVVAWIVVVVVGVVATGAVLFIVFGFVHWLIVEPFMNSESYWKIKDKLKRK